MDNKSGGGQKDHYSIHLNQKQLYWIIIGILLVSAAAIQAVGMKYNYTDESYYIYAAKLLTEGLVPYKDFFFAHPPLFIYLPASFQILLQDPFLGSRVCCILFSALSAVMVFLIAKKMMSLRSAAIAAGLFILSYCYFREFSLVLGFETTTFFMLLALYLYINDRMVLSGIFLGAAILTRLFAVLFFAAICIDILLGAVQFSDGGLKVKKNLRPFALPAACICTVSAVFLIFGIFSSDILNDLLFYHFDKVGWPLSSKLKALLQFLSTTYYVFIPALAGLTFLSDRRMRLLYLSIAVMILGIMLQKNVFAMYFSLSFGFACIACAYAFDKAPKSGFYPIALLLLFSIGIISVASTFMQNSYDTVIPLSDYIRSNTVETDTITGHSNAAAIAAILSDRRITGDYIDTFNKHFQANPAELNNYISLIDEERPKFIVCIRNQGICDMKVFKDYLDEDWKVVKTWKDDRKGTIDVWERKISDISDMD